MKDPRDTPQLEDLHLLTVLAEARSFTRTALRLGISKASVSARVADLERRTGTPLVARTTRSVRLTEAGSRLVEDVAPALAHIAESWGRVKDDAGAPRGLVRLTAPVALGRQRLVPLLPAFLAAHPEVRLELDLSDRLVRLSQEGFDLAVRHVSAPPDNHVAWPLCDSRSHLVASADYLRRHGVPQQPADLAGHNCLPYLRDGASQTWSFQKKGTRAAAGRVGVAVSGNFRANNSEVLREAVMAGAGIGLLPDFSAQEALAQGRLQTVLPGWTPVGFFGDRIWAIRPWAPHVPRAVQLLVAHLRQGMGSATLDQLAADNPAKSRRR